MKIYSFRNNEAAGYMEHFFIDEGGNNVLVATLYECIEPRGWFSFSHRWGGFITVPKRYPRVIDAKEDLFLAIEWHTKNKVDTDKLISLEKLPVVSARDCPEDSP